MRDGGRWDMNRVGHREGGSVCCAHELGGTEWVGYASGWDMRRKRVLESREGSANQRQDRPHRKAPQDEVERHAWAERAARRRKLSCQTKEEQWR